MLSARARRRLGSGPAQVPLPRAAPPRYDWRCEFAGTLRVLRLCWRNFGERLDLFELGESAIIDLVDRGEIEISPAIIQSAVHHARGHGGRRDLEVEGIGEVNAKLHILEHVLEREVRIVIASRHFRQLQLDRS